MSTPTISISEASGCDSSSPTSSTNRSSKETNLSYSASVWGTNTVSASEDHAFTVLLTSRFCMDQSFQRPSSYSAWVSTAWTYIFPSIVVNRGDQSNLVSSD